MLAAGHRTLPLHADFRSCREEVCRAVSARRMTRQMVTPKRRSCC
jgi:hypothetical protein